MFYKGQYGDIAGLSAVADTVCYFKKHLCLPPPPGTG
jgi:hypothetical protein